MGDDGRFYDITDELGGLSPMDKDIDYDPANVAEERTSSAGHGCAQ